MISIDLPYIWSEKAKSSGLMQKYGFLEIMRGEGLVTWQRPTKTSESVLGVATSMLDLKSELADLLIVFYNG